MKTSIQPPGMWPYLAAMFLNAFVDLGHKILVQNTVFKIYDGQSQVVLTAVLNGLILLPYIALFAPVAFWSDRYPKQRVMQWSAWGAVALTLAITLCYYRGWFWAAFCFTLLMGVQSAVYSPAKYGYLKPLVGKERLARGNGAVQAVTIVAILAGTFLFSILFEQRFGRFGAATPGDILRAIAPLGWLLVIHAAVELALVYRLPALEPGDRTVQISWRAALQPAAVGAEMAALWRRPGIRVAIVGLAVFWSVSQVVLATFPAFAKARLGVDNTVLLQGMLASTAVGIMAGSLLAGRWSRHHIELGLVPVGASGIALGLWLLPGLDAVWLHCFNFVLLGVAGGLFIVPLTALMQFLAGPHELGKILAGNNLVQNMAMLGCLGLTAAVSAGGLRAGSLLLGMAVLGTAGVGYTVWRLPQSLLRLRLAGRFGWQRKLWVSGLAHLPASGGVLLRCESGVGWCEWALLQSACPRPIRLVVAGGGGLWRGRGTLVIAPGAGVGPAELDARLRQSLDDGEVCLVGDAGQEWAPAHCRRVAREHRIVPCAAVFGLPSAHPIGARFGPPWSGAGRAADAGHALPQPVAASPGSVLDDP